MHACVGIGPIFIIIQDIRNFMGDKNTPSNAEQDINLDLWDFMISRSISEHGQNENVGAFRATCLVSFLVQKSKDLRMALPWRHSDTHGIKCHDKMDLHELHQKILKSRFSNVTTLIFDLWPWPLNSCKILSMSIIVTYCCKDHYCTRLRVLDIQNKAHQLYMEPHHLHYP